MSTKLAHQTQKTAGIGNGMRTATIAAVSGSTVTLSVAGGTFSQGVGVLGTYVPVVGDTVAVFRQDSSWLILGAIGNGGINGGTITGTVFMDITASALVSTAVSFGATFAVPPMVSPNIDVATGALFRWCSRAVSITTTGFTMQIFSAENIASTTTDVPVSWSATAR